MIACAWSQYVRKILSISPDASKGDDEEEQKQRAEGLALYPQGMTGMQPA